MYRKLFCVLVGLFLLPTLILAQDGKLRGKVSDKETGEPLVGATVFIEGTTLGAAADINGDFIVLGVRSGVYTVKASFVGYAEVRISNIRVSAGITTTQDFELTNAAVQVRAIDIIAERPLIQRNTTNTVRITTSEEIQNLPVRGVANIIALEAGVVRQTGNLYVRGGRSGEVSYYVDGAPTTNPFFNQDNIALVQEGIEEIQLQAGGYTAEFGGSNSGIVKTNLKTGGTDYKASVTYETDDFAKPGKEFLGTTAQGYRNIVATVSGPMPGVDALRFFVLYQNDYRRNRTNMWLTPFSFDSLLTDTYDPHGAGNSLPSAFTIKENFIPHNFYVSNSFQGTLQYDMNPIKLHFTGSYQHTQAPDVNQADWSNTIYNYYRQDRTRLTDRNYVLLSLRATHVIDANTFYELAGTYNARSSETYDPVFKKDWRSYTDSVANAALGYTGFINHWAGPQDYSVINGFNFANENQPNNLYNIQNQNSIGGSLDFTRQMSRTWELKVGGRYDRWTMRNFTISSITGYMTYLYGKNGTTNRLVDDPQMVPGSEYYRTKLAKAGNINNYGYDVDGNLINSGMDAPYHPIFLSAYVQNKLEYRDVILNVGLRWEYFKPNAKTFDVSTNPLTDFNQDLDVIDPALLVNQPTFSFILPRVSFSFPVTAATVFYAQYGKYAQMPSLNNLYVGNVFLSRTVSPASRGNAYLTPVGFLMTPERTTQYEMGIRQLLSDNFAFTLSGFYKDTRDQLQVRNVVNDQGVALYRSYLNVDFGTTKGIELTLELRRTNRLSARVNYTLSDARGTGSNPNSAFGQVEQGIGRQINFINPLAFNQTHRGSVLLDYRWPLNEGGPILSGFGGNLLITFNSGHPYTKIKGLSSLGQSDAWTVGVYPTQDPRYSYPIEAVNSSTTPFVLNVDLNLSKMFEMASVKFEVFVNVTNLLNTKQILNVYPTTGVADDDGWLTNPLAAGYTSIPGYSEFYKAVNLDNRWSYLQLPANGRGQTLGGEDIYGVPRQIRVGVRIEL
jgi:hypothetical protein